MTIMKINVKKQRRFDRSTVIFKLKDKIFLSCAYIINCKNANEKLTKILKYFHRSNTRKFRKNNKRNAEAKETKLKVNGLVNTLARISLFVQFWFKFVNKKHFKDQTVQFTLTFLQNLERNIRLFL